MQNGNRDTDFERSRLNAEFRARLKALGAVRRSYVVRGALSVVLCSALAAFSVLVAAARLFPDWRLLPLFSFLFFWTALAASLVAAVRGHVLPPRSIAWLAETAGRKAGRGGLFSAALEFSGADERLEAYSPYLMAETVRRAGSELERLRPVGMFTESGRHGWTAAGILAGLILTVQILLAGGEAGGVFSSVTDPARYFRLPSGFNLVVTSGDRYVLAGENVDAEAVKFGSSRGDVSIMVNTVAGVWKRIPLAPEKTGRGDVELTVYRHEFDAVREDFSYCFEAGGDVTGTRAVTVLHRPVINRLGAVLHFPPYTRAEAESLAAIAGKLVVLSGTRIELAGETSRRVREGSLVFTGGDRMQLAPRGGGFTCSFTASRDDTFSVEIVDSMGLTNEVAVRYPVVVLEDRNPSIEIVAPADEDMMPRSLAVSLLYRAADDYGISRVRLRFMKENKDDDFRTVELALPAGGNVREIDGSYEWSLEGIGIFPGDRIVYYLEAYDNNTVTGPGYARTDSRRLLVPSLSDIYASIREEEEVQRDDMESILQQGREIQERLRSFSDDFKAQGELDWSRRKEGSELIKRQQELRDKIGQAADRLDQTLQNLERNRMTSQEVGEKIEEIQNLLRQIENEELLSTIERFRKMLEEVSQKDVAEALRQMELSTEDLTQRLDRTIELLKQVLREERMEELVRRMEEMVQEQRALRDSTAAGETRDTGETEDAAETGELSDQQCKLGDEFGAFEKDVKDFTAEQSDSSFASDLEKIMDQMRDAQIAEQMKKAAEQLQQGERGDARCTQDNALDDMLSLYTSMGMCRMNMALAIQQEVMERIDRSARALVEISQLQEGLVSALRGGGLSKDRDGLIAQQLVLREALRSVTQELYTAARRAMSLPAEAFVHLGRALGTIESVLRSVEQEKFSEAAVSAERTYGELNEAVIALLNARASSGGSAGSQRDRMQQMTQQQMSIDQQLQGMMGKNQASMTMEERARMARIAAEQRTLEELVEQISRESAGTGELLGRLDDIADEMAEVARRLEEGELDNELFDREQRILSRMLETTRSVHRRDYKRERVSTTAGDVRALEPGETGAGTDSRELLIEMIRRAMQEKGPAEYEELIRLYFRALSKHVREGAR